MKHKKTESICKNCKHWEEAEQDFGLCKYLEDQVIMPNMKKKFYDKVEKEYKNDGVRGYLSLHDERPDNMVIKINGIRYKAEADYENALEQERDFERNVGVCLTFYTKEKFGCNKFKVSKLAK